MKAKVGHGIAGQYELKVFFDGLYCFIFALCCLSFIFPIYSISSNFITNSFIVIKNVFQQLRLSSINLNLIMLQNGNIANFG